MCVGEQSGPVVLDDAQGPDADRYVASAVRTVVQRQRRRRPQSRNAFAEDQPARWTCVVELRPFTRGCPANVLSGMCSRRFTA